jgi:Bacterial Ig-like domain (group 3)
VYSILVGPAANARAFDKAVADATGGQTFDATSDPSLAGQAFLTAIETILTSLAPSKVDLKTDASTVAPGKPVRLTATVTPSTGSGTVAFTDDGTPMLACQAQSVSSPGVATCDAVFDTTGTHQVTAVFSGVDPSADGGADADAADVRRPGRSRRSLCGSGGIAWGLCSLRRNMRLWLESGAR